MSKILIDEATVKLALEALEYYQAEGLTTTRVAKSITALLRQAIAEAEQAQPEPVAKNEGGSIKWLVDDWPQNCFLYAEPPTWTPVEIGVDVTSEGSHVVGMYVLPDAVRYVFYSQLHPTPPRQPLTDEEIDLFINGRGDEGDDDYVEPTGDGFGLTDADLVRLVRRVEAAHHIIKENT